MLQTLITHVPCMPVIHFVFLIWLILLKQLNPILLSFTQSSYFCHDSSRQLKNANYICIRCVAYKLQSGCHTAKWADN